MSTTTYSQPWDFRCSAMKSAFVFVRASVTVQPKQSQLFQPMGGRAAQLAKRGAPADDGSATAVKGIVSTLNGAASASASCSARILFRRGGGGNAAVLR